MSWAKRLKDNVEELIAAEKIVAGALKGNVPTDNQVFISARTTLGSLRCMMCGDSLVPIFHVPGPYACKLCVNEFREKIAGGEQLFCDMPKKIVDMPGYKKSKK